MAAAEGAGQFRVQAGEGQGRHRRSQRAGAGLSGSRMEELRFDPAWEVETGRRWGAAPVWGPWSSWGRDVVEPRLRDVRRRLPKSGESRPSAIAASGYRLFLYSLASSPAFRPYSRAEAGPAGPLGNSHWVVALLGRADISSPLGTVSERSGLERALDSVGLTEGGSWLVTAIEACGPEDP